jgi:hypothetical protein
MCTNTPIPPVAEQFTITRPNYTRGVSLVSLAFRMPINANRTYDVMSGSEYDALRLNNGDLSITALTWQNYDNTNKVALFNIPENRCFYLSISCLQAPRLKLAKISNGRMGVNFRLNFSGNYIYFQTPAVTATVGAPAGFMPLALEVNESGVPWWSGANTTGVITVPPAFGSYFLQVAFYISPGNGDTELIGASIADLFEVEPYFVITKHKINPCV